ncbi:lipocalin family protein [Acinetobacter sp. ANC 4636]
MNKKLKTKSWFKKLVVATVLLGIGTSVMTHAQKPMPTIAQVDLAKYLGVWYEIARKPMYYQKQCARNVQAVYTLNVNGNISVENSCVNTDGHLEQAQGEAYVVNAPHNSKLRVSFLPESLRWLPVGRGDYWILKLDENYHTVLVGEPKRKYLWILSREPHLSEDVVQEYIKYAQSLGYNTNDLIRTLQTEKNN